MHQCLDIGGGATKVLGLHGKGGSSFGLNVKKPTSWAKGGGRPPGPPPGSAPDKVPYMRIMHEKYLFDGNRIKCSMGVLCQGRCQDFWGLFLFCS